MANTTMNTFGNERICVIPFDTLNEFESLFALMDETWFRKMLASLRISRNTFKSSINLYIGSTNRKLSSQTLKPKGLKWLEWERN